MSDSSDRPQRPHHPGIFNVTVHYDIWVYAASKEDATQTALSVISEAVEEPFDMTTYTMEHERDIPARVREMCPFVSQSIPNYEPVPEDTIIVLHRRLHGKT